jgi:hypothetical protein
MFLKRLAAASAAAIAVLAVGVTPAFAAPPANDRFPNATIVPGVPFTNIVNTRDATLAADDPNCGDESHTVWYRFTPAQSARYQFAAATDGFNPSVAVFSGPRGALQFVACAATGDSTTITRADLTAGTTYRIMVGTYGGRSEPSLTGGRLTFRVTKPVLPTATVTFGRATVDTVSGIVRLRGTVTCNATATAAGVFGTLRQVRGGFVARGFGGTDVACGTSPTPWTIVLESETIRAFVPGSAAFDFSVFACDTFECVTVREGTVRPFLRGV